MAKIFNHAVKYNGKYYPPNTPIVEKPVESVDTSTGVKPDKKTPKGKVKKDD